ncbi:MAG: SDR family NAD(P)-dependent oxidoreductase [Nitrososphaeria archaeon]
MRLKNKVCLVTGASRGIGRAIAVTFGREGADVVVNYSKSKDKAEEVVNEIVKFGRRAIAVKADVSNKDEVEVMVKTVIKEFGKIDVLVNNAGITWKPTNILEGTREEWERVLGVNLIGTYYCIQAVAPYMIKQKYGKIINISSLASIGTTFGEQVAYGPSKAAINILTKRLAYELGQYNIYVNAIAPGLIRTEILSVGRSEEELQKLFNNIANMTALRRIGEPQDIANVALFLASDESNFVTGQIIVADGGRFNFLSHSI